MFPSFARQTVTRERPIRVSDGRGGFEDDWTTPNTLTLDRCTVQPGASAEDLTTRAGVLIAWTVMVAGEPDVLASDRVVVRGVPYSIDGEPARWPSATGGLDNTVLLLKRWEG